MIERDELVRRIRLGEDSTLELKRVLLAGSRITAPNRNEFADELAGMANGWGGTVVLGVEDRSRDSPRHPARPAGRGRSVGTGNL